MACKFSVPIRVPIRVIILLLLFLLHNVGGQHQSEKG